jgi:amicyanin
MAKKISIIVLVLAVLVGGIYAFMVRSDSNSASTQEPIGSSSVDIEDSTEAEMTQQQQSNAGNTYTANAPTSIEIKDFAYSPANVTVKKGTTVTWTNQDSMRHDVNPDDSTEEFKKSSLLAKGESYTVTFNTVGTYSYYCSPHPYMKGTITVIE